jgi:hypothetical protein
MFGAVSAESSIFEVSSNEEIHYVFVLVNFSLVFK